MIVEQSEVTPNSADLILIDGVFCQFMNVESVDVLATMVTNDCNAPGPNDAPVIRNV